MQAAPARYVSVSELYSTDEVELLLDEIRELEPTSCRGEDVQDFEIAGSGSGLGGGRSPAGTEHSWDSHAQYSRAPPPRPRPLAPVYCRLDHLMTPQGALGLLLLLASGAACACVWAACGVRVARLPHAARLRLLLLAALTSALLQAALLSMHVTRLAALLPLDWRRLQAGAAGGAALALAAAGGGALLALRQPAYRAAPRLHALLCTAAGLGLAGAVFAVLLCAVSLRGRCAQAAPPGAAYRAVPAQDTDNHL